MRTAESRFRFLAEHQLSITWGDDGASVFWRGKSKPGQPGAFFPVSSAKTLEEAVDLAISRWERKHKRAFGGTV